MGGGAQIPDFETQKPPSGHCPTALQAGGPTAHGWDRESVAFPSPLLPGPVAGGVRRQVPSGHALCPAAQPAWEEAHRAGGRAPSQGGSNAAHGLGPSWESVSDLALPRFAPWDQSRTSPPLCQHGTHSRWPVTGLADQEGSYGTA